MSDNKLISPLLDGYAMGNAISEHDGVRCHPAINLESENKYIVKVISIPASQANLDALLLAGAFPSKESALEYFKDLADGVAMEAELLERLAKLEGFLSFDGFQIVLKENGAGFEVYLVSQYRPTLARFFKRSPMTHLGAVNLGLDLCAALAVCRKCGYLYVDLKPSNIFVCDDHEYRIGDLGFIPLSSLQFTSLPDKYRSAYTAPEITDAYSSLNTTLDVYAIGLILYQAYNNGELPHAENGEPFAPPAYCDYEMAEIILKACSVNPEDRWADPLEMGQALISYMQRNGANDTPIVPTSMFTGEYTNSDAQQEEPAAAAEDNLDGLVAGVEEAIQAELSDEGETAAENSVPAPESDTADEQQEESVEDTGTLESILPSQDLEFIQNILADETAPSDESIADLDTGELTEEASLMLAQADELITHEIPEPVRAPDPIDVQLPTAVAEEPEEVDVPEEDTEEAEETADELAQDQSDEEAEDWEEEEFDEEAYAIAEEKTKKTNKVLTRILAILATVLVTVVLFLGAFVFYEYYYLQPVSSLTLEGHQDSLSVRIDSEIDNDLLQVICSDTHGNTIRQSVVGGVAQFTGLKPDTRYHIEVQISGFHKLVGITSDYYTTPTMTSIVSFSAVAGPEDGSVILNFTIQGEDAPQWQVYYSAEGTEEKSISFTGHMVTITELEIGSKYQFRLVPVNDTYLVGTNTVEYTATKILYAENLQISGIADNKLTLTWNAPEGSTIESWTVRCYNAAENFESIITVQDTTAVFENIDPTKAYTVDVTAAGMTVGSRTYVSANAITITELDVKDSSEDGLTIKWKYTGKEPVGGWHVLYTIDGSAEPQLIYCQDTLATISDPLPGSVYNITVQAANGTSIFNNSKEYKMKVASKFDDFGITADNMHFSLCLRPDDDKWTADSITYVSEFKPEDKAAVLMHVSASHSDSSDQVAILLVLRNAEGVPVSVSSQGHVWSSLWNDSYGILNLPKLPSESGEYTLTLYFDGAEVTTKSFYVAASDASN